ncbi:MAG: hypothetical protein IJ929_07295 [Prevotella sp.]|nr:hypothetical protein [Prevotella sp.]
MGDSGIRQHGSSFTLEIWRAQRWQVCRQGSDRPIFDGNIFNKELEATPLEINVHVTVKMKYYFPNADIKYEEK